MDILPKCSDCKFYNVTDTYTPYLGNVLIPTCNKSLQIYGYRSSVKFMRADQSKYCKVQGELFEAKNS